jgi:2Fe-2S ferredoxin
MLVITGLENTSEMTENELKFKKLNKLHPNERLACQTQISGDIIIEVCEENKLPHMEYSN